MTLYEDSQTLFLLLEIYLLLSKWLLYILTEQHACQISFYLRKIGNFGTSTFIIEYFFKAPELGLFE